jgi:hypothetical protein
MSAVANGSLPGLRLGLELRDGGWLVFARFDPPDQVGELGKEPREPVEDQRDQKIPDRISGPVSAEVLQEGGEFGHGSRII